MFDKIAEIIFHLNAWNYRELNFPYAAKYRIERNFHVLGQPSFTRLPFTTGKLFRLSYWLSATSAHSVNTKQILNKSYVNSIISL